MLSGRAAVELWSGRPEEAVRILEAGLAAEAAAGREYEQADWAGPLALAEALAGRLSRAAELAGQALPGGMRAAARPAPAPQLRLSRWPGCIWSATSCTRPAAPSCMPTPPSAPAPTG